MARKPLLSFKVKRIIVGSLTLGFVLFLAFRYVSMQMPAYDASGINTVYNRERFSVKLSSDAKEDVSLLSEIRNNFAKDGISVSGTLYRDSMFDDYALVKAGCLAFTTENGEAIPIPAREYIDEGIEEEKKLLSGRGGQKVTEQSREYGQDVSGAVSGVVSMEIEKEGKRSTIRAKLTVKGNESCMAYVGAPEHMIEPLYRDIVASFSPKW